MALSSEKPTKIRWAVFVLACGTSWMMYLHRYLFALIKPRIAEEWNLGTDELGLLDSAFSLAYMLFQFPLGIAADAFGVHFVLTCLILLWATGLGMHAWAPSAKYMWFARATLGMGQSAVYANLSRIAKTWFPVGIRTSLQGFAGVTSGRVGGLCGYLLIGTLMLGVLNLNWRTAVYVCVAFGVGQAILFFCVFRNSPTQHPLVNEAEAQLIEGVDAKDSTKVAGKPEKARMSVREMLTSLKPRALLNLIFLNMQTIFSTFADNIYSSWIPLFLWQVHNLKFREMGLYSSLPLLGGAIAGLIGGLLNDYFISRTGNRRWSRSGVAFCGKGMAAVLLFTGLLWYDSPYVFCAFLFFVKLFGDWSLTTTWGVVTDIGGRATASVFAYNNAIAAVGAILAPIIYGFLAEHRGWRIVFVFAAATYVMCALSWVLVNCTIPVIQSDSESTRGSEAKG